MTDRGLPLVLDERLLGLRRTVVRTPVGPVVARVGAVSGGPGVVLIHGAAGSWTTWTPMLQRAADEGRPLPNVVALDLPGWGESPDPTAPIDAATAADVVATVARAAGHASWRVVGHSLGGFVALELAAREPGATLGVVLVSPTGPAVVEAVRHPVAGGLRLRWFAGMLLAMRALAALPGGGRFLVRLVGRTGAFGPLSAPLFAGRGHPSVAAAFGDEIRPRAFVRAARAAGRADLRTWQAVRCPVRSIRGRRDVFVGARDAAALARLLPDFAEEVVDGAGHFAAIERPDAVLRALQSLPDGEPPRFVSVRR